MTSPLLNRVTPKDTIETWRQKTNEIVDRLKDLYPHVDNNLYVENDAFIKGNLTVDGQLHVKANLIVDGTTTTINTTELNIEDNTILLNSNLTGTPPNVLESGIEVNRGSSDNKRIYWDEATLRWVIEGDLDVSGDINNSSFQWALDPNTNHISNLNSGNVGIGTTNPSSKLSVNIDEDNSSVTDLRTIVGIDVYNHDDSVGSKSAMIFKTPGSGIGWVAERVSSDSMKLHLTTESGLGTPKVTFTNAGAVGIGTTQPSAELDVYGDIKLGSHTNDGVIKAWTSRGTDEGGNSTVGSNLILKAGIGTGIGSNGQIEFHTEHSETNYGNGNPHGSGSAKMVIQSDGKVGIGTGSPRSNLEIEMANGEFSQIINKWIDYRGVGNNTQDDNGVSLQGYLLLIPAHPDNDSSAQNAVSGKKFYGTISADRGSVSSGNHSETAKIQVSTAYWNEWGILDISGNSTSYFTKLSKVKYDGTLYIAAHFKSTGGGPTGGLWVSEASVKGLDDNCLKMVYHTELDDYNYNGGAEINDGIIISDFGSVFKKFSGGNFGIGTSNPAEKLEVNGAIKLDTTTNNNVGTIRWTGTDFQGNIDGTSGGWTSLTGGNAWSPATNSGDIHYSSGNVGIGTNNPSAKLEVLTSGSLSAFNAGKQNTSTGTDSVAIGRMNNATGNYSSAIGFNNDATGNMSFSCGESNESSGIGSFSSGILSKAQGSYSTAMGGKMTVAGNYSFGVGLDSTARTFSQANTMAIMGGNVGIGTVTPSEKLEVSGTSSFIGESIDNDLSLSGTIDSCSITDDGKTVALIDRSRTDKIVIYELDQNNNWVERDSITPYGDASSIAISGDGSTLAVGNPGFDYSAGYNSTLGQNFSYLQNGGLVSVYHLNTSNNKFESRKFAIPPTQYLQTHYGSNHPMQFGHSVSLNKTGNKLAIGMNGFRSVSGSSYYGAFTVYNVGSSFVGVQSNLQLDPVYPQGLQYNNNTIADYLRFGQTISISDNDIVCVGFQEKHSTNQEGFQLFDISQSTPPSMYQEEVIASSSSISNDHFIVGGYNTNAIVISNDGSIITFLLTRFTDLNTFQTIEGIQSYKKDSNNIWQKYGEFTPTPFSLASSISSDFEVGSNSFSKVIHVDNDSSSDHILRTKIWSGNTWVSESRESIKLKSDNPYLLFNNNDSGSKKQRIVSGYGGLSIQNYDDQINIATFTDSGTIRASNLTGDTVLVSNSSKDIISSSITTTELDQLSGINTNETIQDQLDDLSIDIGNVDTSKWTDIATGIYRNSNVGIGNFSSTALTEKLEVDGNISATGSISAVGTIQSTSDITLKENLEIIENPIEKIKEINGYTYNMIGKDERFAGLVAQEVEKVLPEVVREHSSGTKSLAYGNLMALLVETVKEQQKQIDELKKLISDK